LRACSGVNQAKSFGVIFQTDPIPALDSKEQKGNNVLHMFL
jgi:hypothetical protein